MTMINLLNKIFITQHTHEMKVMTFPIVLNPYLVVKYCIMTYDFGPRRTDQNVITFICMLCVLVPLLLHIPCIKYYSIEVIVLGVYY